MFTRAQLKTVWWPVTVGVPKDGGGVTRHTFEAELEILRQSEFDAVYGNGGNDRDLVRRVLRNWRKYGDENGSEIEFSPEALDEAIDVPYVRAALVTAYLQASSGREAARKN